MELEQVRVCPVCETENPPERARCRCGASLSVVDFTLKRAPADAAIALSPPTASVSVENGALLPSPDDGLTAGAAAAARAPKEPSLRAGELTAICPYADCAQLNPAGQERCSYCNRPLQPPAANADRDLRPLPTILRDDFRTIEALPAAGAEADLLIVRQVRSGDLCVAKLYRKGLEPDLRLLGLLSQVKGHHVARLLAYGVSDGTAYEVQEYIAHGTLRDWMRGRLLARDDIRRIVEELSDALNEIHALRILHRDLKPENVLVRSTAPLELALTDFGIASLREATQHFTGGARTAKYAAPEALTGVIDEKTDWWACGMIVLEAATGRHPFDGLNEQVINHRLATLPIDVRGVYDDALRSLCRGLLLRDPKRRWGGAEVARWLANDPTLPAPDEAEGPASAVRSYRIGKLECTSAAELAAALARHWDAGAKDLARGQIARWVEHELHDYNLVRKLRDLDDERGVSVNMRLLRFLFLCAPDMPAVWRGAPVSSQTLLDSARRSESGDAASEAWLDSIASEGVLAFLASTGNAELAGFDRRWREGWARFSEIWQHTVAAEDAWRKQPRPVAGVESARVVSFDDLVFGVSDRLVLPPREKVNGALLLALHDEPYAAALRGEVAGRQGEIAGFCPWYDALWQLVEKDSVAILVAKRMLPHARDDASAEIQRQAATKNVRVKIVDEARADVRVRLAEVLGVDADGFDLRTATRLLRALERFQEACHRALGLGFADAEYLSFCRGMEKISRHGLDVQDALTRCEEIHATNAIVMQPERMVLALLIAGIIGFILVFQAPWLAVALAMLATCAFGWRWYIGFQARERALAALRLLRLHAKGIVGGFISPQKTDTQRPGRPVA